MYATFSFSLPVFYGSYPVWTCPCMPNLTGRREAAFFRQVFFFAGGGAVGRGRAGRRAFALSAHPRIISLPRRGEDRGDGLLVCPHAGPCPMKAGERRALLGAGRLRDAARDKVMDPDPDVRGGSHQTRSKMPSKTCAQARELATAPASKLGLPCRGARPRVPALYHMSHDTISMEVDIDSVHRRTPAAFAAAPPFPRARPHRNAPRRLRARARARRAAGAASGRSRPRAC